MPKQLMLKIVMQVVNFIKTIKMIQKNKKAQIQIQEMAFVLVGIFLFFGLVFLGFTMWQSAQMKGQAEQLRLEKSIAMVSSLISQPEFSCSKQQGYCIDEDKLNVFINNYASDIKYKKLWSSANVNFIEIKRVYPKTEGACQGNYPNCNYYVVYDAGGDKLIESTFANLCHYDSTYGYKCDIAEVLVGVKPTTK